MILIMFVTLAAGLPAMAVTASSSLLLAFLVGPLIGSIAGLFAAQYIAVRHGSEGQWQHDLDRQTDEMVAALRSVYQRTSEADDFPLNSAGKLAKAA